MGRNQFDITEEDLRDMRDAHSRAAAAVMALTPEQRQAAARLREAEAAQKAVDARAKAKADKAGKEAALLEDQRRFELLADKVAKQWPELLRLEWQHPLFRLSQENYAAYLATPEWKAIRRRVLKRDGNLCCTCGAKAQCVHHISYDQAVMLGKRDEDLVSLCHPCHKEVEFDGKGGRSEADKLAVLHEKRIRFAASKPV